MPSIDQLAPYEDIILASMGLKGWTCDPALITATISTGAGVMRATSLPLRTGQVISKVVMFITSLGAGATPTLIRIGIYTPGPTRTLVASTADLHADTQFTATNLIYLTFNIFAGTTGTGTAWTVPSDGLYGVGYLEVGAWGTTPGVTPTYLTWGGGQPNKHSYPGTTQLQRQWAQASLSDLPTTATAVASSTPYWFAVL